MEQKIRAEFKIIGKVQGVGFRYFVYRTAKELGLSGYAKNLWDGSVEVVAEGPKRKIDILHSYLIQGPSMARVTDCFRKDYDFKDEFDSFTIY